MADLEIELRAVARSLTPLQGFKLCCDLDDKTNKLLDIEVDEKLRKAKTLVEAYNNIPSTSKADRGYYLLLKKCRVYLHLSRRQLLVPEIARYLTIGQCLSVAIDLGMNRDRVEKLLFGWSSLATQKTLNRWWTDNVHISEETRRSRLYAAVMKVCLKK
ncbi:unnamed protein product [Dimorphilus gyrociliatus]|uniref:Uncharacterized protein n=1 Tax=Dimorphilus gyrociliatus TaxID=2664684 RepID=A0A7I8VQK7_9ANNE|nr:unnamed protein product [Dimorphilus gyrociliatus]